MGTKNYNNYSDMITFSRASSGTALAKISYGAELVTNGTFDTDSDWFKESGWTISGGTAVGTSVPAFNNFYQASLDLVAGKVYQISASIVASSGGVQIYLGTNGNSSALVYNGDGSKELNVFFTYAAGQNNTFIFRARSTGFTGTIDNVSIKEVLYDQPDGTLQLFNHPANQPRVEYDAQGNRLGLLVEEARTNLLLNSRIASGGVLATGWNVQGATASAPTSTAPDGSTDGVAVSITTNTGNNLAYLLPGLTIGQTYTASMWLKGVAGDQIYFNAEDAAAAQELVTFTGDWQRVSKTYTATSTSQYFACEIFNRSGGAHLPNVSFEAWGAQYELGTFPTSYIPTSGATATRSADVASIGVGAFGYNKGAGSVLVVADTISTSANNHQDFRLTGPVSGNSVNSGSRVGSGSAGQYTTWVQGGGSTVALLTVNDAVNDGAQYKASYRFAKNDFALSVSGGSVVSDTTGAMPVSINTLNLGYGYGYLNGHISSIAYYPRRLTDAQIKALTSPPETPTLSLTFDDSSTSYLETSIHG